jgi:hypothetical protein
VVTFFTQLSFVIKLCQDACLGNSSDEFEYGLSRIKNLVTGAKNRKILLTLVATVFIQISWKLVWKFVLMISRSKFQKAADITFYTHWTCKNRLISSFVDPNNTRKCMVNSSKQQVNEWMNEWMKSKYIIIAIYVSHFISSIYEKWINGHRE